MITNVPCISRELEYILRIMSLWPDSNNIVTCVFLCSSWIATIPFQLMHFVGTTDNVIELMAAVFDIANEVALLFKMIAALVNRKVLISLIVEMAEDWKQWNFAVTSETRAACLFARCDFYLYCGAVAMLFPRLMINYFTDGVNNREFMLKTLYPFDDHRSPIYELIMIIQFIHIVLIIFVEFLLQALMIAAVCHSGVQNNMMNQRIIEFTTNAKKENIVTRTNNSLSEYLVRKHQKNIHFAERIEEVFVFISLFHCLNSITTICCCGLVFVMTDDPIDILRFLVPMIMRLVQTFVLCYAGEYLVHKNLFVADTVYHSDWYLLHPKYKKMLHLILLRAQKPLVLTAGKFAILTSETFTIIMKTSGSYISVLRAMYRN